MAETLLLALSFGVLAGLRTMSAPTAVSWAAKLGLLPLSGTPLAFLGWGWLPWLLTAGALVELVLDQLPSTPSRKRPAGFAARIVTGSLSGAAVGAAHGGLLAGLLAGLTGAVLGTLGGYAARRRLAAAFGKDLPAALLEDAVAVGGAILLVLALP
jgi:uncharacterized membrane protein